MKQRFDDIQWIGEAVLEAARQLAHLPPSSSAFPTDFWPDRLSGVTGDQQYRMITNRVQLALPRVHLRRRCQVKPRPSRVRQLGYRHVFPDRRMNAASA